VTLRSAVVVDRNEHGLDRSPDSGSESDTDEPPTGEKTSSTSFGERDLTR
jgi:hypothetical protein